MEILEIMILCFFNMFSLLMGVKIGQRSIRGREIELNPVRAIKNEIRDNKEEKVQSLKRSQIDTMLYNIDNYDGTGLGQKQIPKE